MSTYTVTRCGKIFVDEIELHQTIRKDGCHVVWLNNKIQYVHRLVAEAYLSNDNNKKTVNHKDGNRSNNNVENLEWMTIAENLQHARLNKLWGKNILIKRKLTDTQVEEIRNKYIPRKYSMYRLSEEYGVDYKTIHNIVNHKNYNKKKEDYIV